MYMYKCKRVLIMCVAMYIYTLCIYNVYVVFPGIKVYTVSIIVAVVMTVG
jgi:hypothetical protein